MPEKYEAPHDGGATRNSCGGQFQSNDTPHDWNEQALAFHIQNFVPYANGEELNQRIALLKARDFAAALRGTAISTQACSHAYDAHELAGAFVFAPVSLDLLKCSVKYCRHLVASSYLAEFLDGEFDK